MIHQDSVGGRKKPMSKGYVTVVCAQLEKFSLYFSSSSFVIRVNLLHPKPSLFFYGLLLSLWCFPISVNYYFQLNSGYSRLPITRTLANSNQNNLRKQPSFFTSGPGRKQRRTFVSLVRAKIDFPGFPSYMYCYFTLRSVTPTSR